MAPSSSIEVRRLVVMKLLREGRIGPDARLAPSAKQPMTPAADAQSNVRSGAA
jgi:hypothetical protein